MPQPEMDVWASSLAIRYVYGTLPALDGQWVGGDFDSPLVFIKPSSVAELDAALLGPSSDPAAAVSTFMDQAQKLKPGSFIFHDALASRCDS